jgi:hypothetical protein
MQDALAGYLLRGIFKDEYDSSAVDFRCLFLLVF